MFSGKAGRGPQVDLFDSQSAIFNLIGIIGSPRRERHLARTIESGQGVDFFRVNTTPSQYRYEPHDQIEREKRLFESIFVMLVGTAVLHAKRMCHISN